LFTAEDGSFTAAFPRAPVRTSIIRGYSYSSLILQRESYSISFEDSDAPAADEFELRMRWASEKRSGAKTIVHQGHSGIEYKETIGTSEQTVRVFIVKQRKFYLKAKTPILSVLPSGIRLAYEKKIADFFNAFKIGTIPPAHYAMVPALPDVFGEVSPDNVYRSPYFGFTVTLPKEWKTEGPEKLKEKKETDLLTEYSELASVWRKRNRRRIVSAFRELDPNVGGFPKIVISAHRPDERYESLEKYVEFETEEDKFWWYLHPVGEATAMELAGQKFLTYEIIDKTDYEQPELGPVRGKHFITELDGVYLSFKTIYRDEKDGALLTDVVRGITFSKRRN
jgi:hypothetical protein